MVAVEKVSYDYGERVITYPDFTVPQGEKFAIMGNSGTGKTTLLHLLAGLLSLQTGSIRINDTILNNLRPAEMDLFRGKNIGLVFQRPHLINALTVMDNLLSAQYFSGIKIDKSRVQEVLDELNIGDLAGKKPYQLSQGEAQRVTIARAVLNRPKLILADEPTSALDDENSSKVLKMLMREAENYEAALIVVTHDQRVKDSVPQSISLNHQ